MTVPTQTNKAIFTANGVTTEFPFTFGTLPTADLVVTLIDGDTETVVNPSDYTVRGAGRDDGGSVVFNEPPASGLTILIQRLVPYTQPTDYKNQGSFYPRTHERSFDRATMQVQQLAEEVGRSFRLPPQVQPGVSLQVPAPRPLSALVWDETGTRLENGDVSVTGDMLLRGQLKNAHEGGTALVGFLPAGLGAVPRTLQDKLRETVSVRDFGATGDGVTDDRAALQDAIDAAAGVARLHVPAGIYRVSGALRFRSGSHFVMGGIDKTVFKLTDDAPIGVNVMEPFAFDGSVENVTFEGGFTVDGNFARNGGAYGSDRPGSSGFITAGARNIRIIGGAKAVDCSLHGFDICCGGEDDGGLLRYVASANAAESYYPANETVGFYADVLYATNAGDDNITGHYSRDVHIGKVVSWDSGKRHTTPHASNCFEIDDGCRGWSVGMANVSGGARGLAIKCHAPEPAPNNITIGPVVASRCHQGLSINDEGWPNSGPARDSAHTVTVESVTVTEPEATVGATIQHNAVEVRSYDNVTIGPVNVAAQGTESGLRSAILLASAADNVTIGDVQVVNWPYAADSDTADAAIGITSTTGDVSIGFVRARNCGWRGIASTSASRLRVAGAELIGDSIANSIGIRLSVRPAASGSSIGPIYVTGYSAATSYDTGEASARGKSYAPGDVGFSGRLYAGSITTPGYHHIHAADLNNAGDEIFRIEGARVALNVYERGSGGSFGTGAGNAILKVGTMEGTGRSIAAGGTINASGADYAEYMELQPHLWGNVPKGALLGLDAGGLLTDRWSEIIGPVLVKSTSPNLVGGDAWGTEEALCAKYGVQPVGDEPGAEATESERAAWAERKSQMAAALETERRRWDRMALCGQVPVNVEATEEDVGKFLVASEGEGGVVAGVLVSRKQLRDNPADALDVIGRVVRIAEDGRPVVLVR